ncbi:MAG: 30S ribosomal protein S19 [Candidatus Altiarchaeales archaeon]|nr:30S ribosomal protein S19 [Candidatus Altiarchaeales archaeon]MBD3416338.1 30S ribosomal protein S19 [Candidatus Altiarchaeales archaeon]
MAKKEFKYRGYKIEELQKMSHDEVLELLPSRARRSLKRGLTEQQQKLLKKVRKARETGQKGAVRTHCRDMVILPEMVGVKFAVYTGKEFSEFEAKTEMIGHYLSEFTLSRRPVKHSAPGVGATRSSLFVPIK